MGQTTNDCTSSLNVLCTQNSNDKNFSTAGELVTTELELEKYRSKHKLTQNKIELEKQRPAQLIRY